MGLLGVYCFGGGQKILNATSVYFQVFEFSNFAKPAFNWLANHAKPASGWLEKTARGKL